MRLLPLLLAFVLLVPAAAAHAQFLNPALSLDGRLLPAEPRPASATRLAPEPSTRRLVLGGTLGWLVGTAAGVAMGHAWASGARGAEAGVEEAFPWIGGVLGGTLGAPVGVHVANRGRGRLGVSVLGSLGAGVATVYLVPDASSAWPGGAVLALGLQVGVSTLLERSTTRAPSEARTSASGCGIGSCPAPR